MAAPVHSSSPVHSSPPAQSSWIALTLEGELDIARIEELDRMVATAYGGDRINAIIDLTDVTFMDSSGLGWLLSTLEHIKKRAGRLRLVAPGGGNLMRLIALTGLEGHFEVFATRVEAEWELPTEAFDAVDQLLAIFADPDTAKSVTRLMNAAGFNEGQIGEAWEQAKKAGYTEWTGLGYRLTNKGRARGSKLVRDVR